MHARSVPRAHLLQRRQNTDFLRVLTHTVENTDSQRFIGRIIESDEHLGKPFSPQHARWQK